MFPFNVFRHCVTYLEVQHFAHITETYSFRYSVDFVFFSTAVQMKILQILLRSL